jgi:RNA polymerase sigma factor (sigma-70 family)
MAKKKAKSTASPRAQPQVSSYALMIQTICAGSAHGFYHQGLNEYLATFSAYPQLSDEEFALLFQQFKCGDQQAKARLMFSYVRFVVRFANAKRGRGLDMEDMMQEGLLGVEKALKKFDPKRGVRFITYAPHWIEQAIERAVLDQGCTTGRRVPVHRHILINRVGRVEREFLAQNDRRANDRELLELIKAQPQKTTKRLSLNKLQELRHEAHECKVSLNRQLRGGRGTMLQDVLPNSQSNTEALVEARRQLARYQQMIVEVKEFIRSVRNPRDAQIVIERLNLDGQGEIVLGALGKKNGLTRERVRQIEFQTLQRIANEFHVSVPEAKALRRIVEELECIVLST